jgi:c-di-GMP-binding flagellar brake protein YcgR
MLSSALTIGQRVRVRPRTSEADIYGCITAVHHGAAVVEAIDRDEAAVEMSPGEHVEVSVFGPGEVLSFTSDILADKGGSVVITLPSVARIVRQRGRYRKPCRIPAVCWQVDKPMKKIEARVEDISLGGFLLSSDTELPVGARLVIRFTLPDCEYEVEAIMGVVRIVPAAQNEDNTPRMGCAFTCMTRMSAARVAQFVESDAATEGPTYERLAG